MTAESDGFLGRWARRKAQARWGAPLPPEPESIPTAPAALSVPASGHQVPASVPASVQARATPAPGGLAADPTASPGSPGSPASSASAGQAEPAQPAPTLQDARQLTPASDFRPFVARAVAPEVRNAAFKQLFSDPHFNVMDGLDIYIDDYSKPDPLPLALARELLEAHFPTPPGARAAAAAPDPASQPAPLAEAATPSASQASATSRPEPETAADALDPAAEAPARAQPPSDSAP